LIEPITDTPLAAFSPPMTVVPLLAEAPKLIADPQVRNRGTIGGDIAHGDPANDHPALSLAVLLRWV
jgi:CO/xanthine dehydrogenase FAD-binding subunit